MVHAANQRETLVETAGESGYSRDSALPFFLQRYANAYRIQLDKFLRAASGEKIALPTGHDGLRALQIANAAQQSLLTGVSVRV